MRGRGNARVVPANVQRFGEGAIGIGRGDRVQRDHAIENVALPFAQRFKVDIGREPRRVVRDRGEQRRLSQIEIARRFAEVRARRRLDAVEVAAHRHAVDVLLRG